MGPRSGGVYSSVGAGAATQHSVRFQGCQRLLDVLSNFIDLARHSGLMSKLPFQRRRQRQQKMRPTAMSG